MSPKPVAMSTFSSKNCIGNVAKILWSRNLNRKPNTTWHQSKTKIGPNWLKLIYEMQVAYFLYPLFTTLQI